MSQQGPIVVVANPESPALGPALTNIDAFPLIETGWPDATDAVARLRPAAVIAVEAAANADALDDLARQAAAAEPYTPLIVLDPGPALPPNALPLASSSRVAERLTARLNAALRVRALHATLLRRLAVANVPLPADDPLHDATALLIGRGGSYPALSIAIGERMGVVGALSIEAAARHLSTRELDGIIIGDGFTPRVVDAFLTVLSEDPRFRNLPVALATGTTPAAYYGLSNLEPISGDPATVAAHAAPLIRQHAFEARIDRALKSIDVGGLLDPRTGLLTRDAFHRDFAAAVEDALGRGAGFAVARIAFTPGATSERVRLDCARILSRLMRRMDFATLNGHDAILIAFADANLRDAHMIVRRLGSVLKHTIHIPGRQREIDPQIAVAALMPGDTQASLLARLTCEGRRAAS
jgi:GGDEF domain-containing protein